MTEKLLFQIEETVKKNRLDNFLCEQITKVSKIFVRNRIDAGFCLINGKAAARGYHLRKGDAVEIELDLTAHTSMLPEALPIEIVYEDEQIIVVNKPPEMLVHPSKNQKSGTLLNALSYYLNRESINTTDESKLSNAKPKIARPGLII
jgi:23S rRNA pseudouridine1911/1915/1917 synthase